MSSLPLIQFGFDKEGRLRLCLPEALWNALKKAAESGVDVEVSEGFAWVGLREIADFDVRSISMVARDEQPPCK